MGDAGRRASTTPRSNMRTRRSLASRSFVASVATTTTATTLLCLVSLSRIPRVGATDQLSVTPYAHAARAALDRAADEDPLAKSDSYASLSESHKDVFRRHSSTRTLEEKTESLEAPIVRHATVEVRLVGFDGDGVAGVRLTERDFAPYLDALRADVPHVALASPDDDDEDDGDDGRIAPGPITTRFRFHVTRASRRLCAKIAAAIDDAIERADATRGSLASATVESSAVTAIPHDVVDAIIAGDRASAADAGTHVLYVLNPAPKAYTSPISGARAYAYAYDSAVGRSPPGVHVGGSSGGWVGASASGCVGQLWTGDDSVSNVSVANGRYAWFDLTAGPVSYGPSDGGEGAVHAGSFPRVRAAHRRRPDQLAVAIAGLLRRASNQLLAPPAAHAVAPKVWRETTVKIVRVTDMPRGNDGRVPPLGIREIESALRKAAAMRVGKVGGDDDDAAVHVTETEVGVGSCSLCVAAMHRALKATARSSDPGSNPGPGGVTDTYAGAEEDGEGGRVLNLDVGRPAGGTHREFVDAAELRYWLSAFRARIADEIEMDLGDRYNGDDGDNRRVIPVFLFDLARTEALLLEPGRESVAAFPDMVVAVRTRSPSQISSMIQCQDLPVLTEPADVHRALLGAVLTSGWGVAPTRLTWSESRGSVARDDAFDVGNSPFGALSPVGRRGRLSFAASDAAKRHAILAIVQDARVRAAGVLTALKGARDGQGAMTGGAGLEFDGRWASMSRKHERALAAEAMHDHARARHFAMSANVDLEALTKLALDAAGKLEARLECFEEAKGSEGLVWRVLSAFAAFVAAYFKGKDAFGRWWNVKVAKQF